MSININELNQEQLNELISQAESRKKQIQQERITALRNRINEIIKAEGFTFEDVFNTKSKTGRSIGKVPPKFANPNDNEQTWSGRGKRPRWFNAALDAGYSKESMLIVRN